MTDDTGDVIFDKIREYFYVDDGTGNITKTKGAQLLESGKKLCMCVGGCCDGRRVYLNDGQTQITLNELPRVRAGQIKPEKASGRRTIYMLTKVIITLDTVTSELLFLRGQELQPFEAWNRIIENYPPSKLYKTMEEIANG